MKKFISIIILISFSFIYSQEKAIENSTIQKTTVEVPKFSDSDIQKHVEEYDAFVKDYLIAAKAKDMTKLGELGQKAQELANKGQSVAEKLTANPDDLKKYTEYIQKLTQEIQTVLSEQ